MMTRLRPLLATGLAAAILIAAAASCGGDSDSGDTPSPTISGTPDLSPRSGGVAAAQRYLQQTGIDGHEGSFTDPVSCTDIKDNTDGTYCIHENFSTYAAGLVILRVADRDNPDKDVWEMRLTPTAAGWQVDSVQPFGENN